MNATELNVAEDCLYPSDNKYDIPCLRSDRQGGHLLLPFAPYGAGRKTKTAQTIHFYVDDYRFASVWKNPAKVLNTCARAVIEPNFSLFDTTPFAQGLDLIYKKRWLARYFQECGLNVYADLNVSSKFYEVNRLGIPAGYNAFATRGTRGHLAELETELMIAREISGQAIPNLIVYGGGQEIHDFCNQNSLTYIHDFMTEKGGANG
ncbi:DUF4417 domain-containing protein [uncultured Duncaniella sp.]|uniref:DUF4417 domain-containing protein n=1 Tax=uncultured Duncaniella sp. TaxID=2768039 RepID=UPI0025B63E5C|nr:DUF4417 domain-containing protein [uncultured Duncaniella sp.]